MAVFQSPVIAASVIFVQNHFLLCIVAIYFLSVLYSRYRPGLAGIPGPELAKWTKLWRLYDVYKCQSHKTAIRLHQEYGPLVRIAPNIVSVGDPKEIKTIYGLTAAFKKVRMLFTFPRKSSHTSSSLHFIPFKVFPGIKPPK